jgi:baculoviral IAP repeat-containing protein 6
MHNDIYFNEPGWVGQKNTANGKKKNEAYCKFIRAANMKFAMLE